PSRPGDDTQVCAKAKGPEDCPPALRFFAVTAKCGQDQKPPMPPMPLMSGIAGIEDLSSGASQIAASVVISKPATEAASCNAVRTTLVGSITPAAARFSYTSVAAL